MSMLCRQVEPGAPHCAARCYATLMATIISFYPDCFNETEGVNNKVAPGLTFPVHCFLFPQTSMITVVLTLVNRSAITAGQFNISADNNLSNCKHMKSSQHILIVW